MNLQILVVDKAPHVNVGMQILTDAGVATQRTNSPDVIWPLDLFFGPAGVTLEEARKAMRRCM